MGKLLAVCGAAIAGFCLVFLAIAATEQPPKKIVSESSEEKGNASRQIAECVLATLRDQDAAAQKAEEADREQFMRATVGMSVDTFEKFMSIMPPPPSVAEIETARNQNLIRVKELCRLKFSASNRPLNDNK